MALRYPSMPSGGVDAGSIIDMFNSGYDRSKARADERKAVDAFGGYLDSVYTNQGAPQSLAALGGLLQSPAAGQVQRSPLPAPIDPATARVEQAFAAQGQGRAPTDLNSNAIAGRFLKTIRDGGVTNPFALAAIAATGKRESGFDPKNAVRTWSDPSQSGQAGTAGGIMSWRNERLQALQQFAQQNGDDPRAPSPETQAKFLLAEDPTLIQKLQNAGSAEEAQQLMNNAWRYAGYNQQGGETAQRMALAGQYAQQFGGSPSQQALEGMAVGQSMPMGHGVQMADASGQMMPQGQLPPLPDRETMLQLFANPITRPLAIQAAQSRIEAMQGQNDPMARVKYETAVAQLEQLRNPQAKPTDDMREYELARSQGFGGTFQDYMIGMKRAGATNVNVGAGEKAWDTESAKLFAKRYDDISAAAGNAQQMLGMYDLAEEAMNTGIRTGIGGEAELTLRQIGAAMGMDTDPKKLAGGELIRAVQNRMALTMRSPDGGMGMPGALSDRDIKFLKDSQIGIDRSPEGNRRMLTAFRAMEQRKMEIAQLADEYVESNGRLDAGFNRVVREYAKNNPLFADEQGKSDRSPRKITSPDEFNALPSGTEFIAPDGSIRRKP